MVERGRFCQFETSLGRRQTPIVGAFVAAMMFLVTSPRTSEALVVGNVNGTVANTTGNPANFPGWTQGDPGWANFSTGGSYVYLGDGWVLSARHVGYNGPIQFQTPTGPASFERIPGSYYLDYGYLWSDGKHYYAVENPSSVQLEGGSVIPLSQFTDLQLFRINGDPGLPSLTIASQSLATTNFTRVDAPQVVVVGGSSGRAANQSQWNANEQASPWIWSQTTGAGEYQGFFTQTDSAQKRWGTNRVADPRPNGPGDPSDPGAMDYSNLFDKGIISDTTGVRNFQTNDGVFRDIIASLVVYDQQGQPGTPAYGINNLEVQAVPGDSGSAVFFKRGNQWELAGIVNAAFTYTDQPGGTAMFGNATMFTDLTKYNQNYFHSIQNIIATHADYSLSGDVNLDGVVSGNGTGPASTDDVTAFIAGWNYNNGTSHGTINSWKKGDLTRDGRTDVADFLRLRGALNGQISSAVVAALFGSHAIPEPSAAMLALLGGLQLVLSRRRR
jgi:hypothetical protein